MTAAAAIHLVVGEEELLRARAVSVIVADALAVDPHCEVREYTAPTLAAADLLDLLTPSLFAERRVLTVTEAQEADRDLVRALLDYAGDPVEGIGVVVVHPGGAKNKALVDGLRKAGAAVVSCPKVTRAEDRAAFVKAEVLAAGGTIEPAAVPALVDAVGAELRELAAAAGQLVTDTGGHIDRAAVRRYYRGRAEVTGFTVADRATSGDVAGAVEALRWAAYLGVPTVLVADALAESIRTVARVSASGRTDQDTVARELGMPPWRVRKARQQARGWSDRGLCLAMQVAAELNAEVKGTVADADYALLRGIRLIASARALP